MCSEPCRGVTVDDRFPADRGDACVVRTTCLVTLTARPCRTVNDSASDRLLRYMIDKMSVGRLTGEEQTSSSSSWKWHA